MKRIYRVKDFKQKLCDGWMTIPWFVSSQTKSLRLIRHPNNKKFIEYESSAIVADTGLDNLPA